MANGNAAEIGASIITFLTAKGIPPTQAWLQTFLSSVRLTTPVVALQQTALFQIRNADLQTSIIRSASTVLPPGITDPEAKEKHIRGPITVQVLDVEDIGRSRWSQVEAIEAQERGETTKGREVIRVVPEENGPDSTAAVDEAKSAGPHKLLLQDAGEAQVYAMEMLPVRGLGLQMSIGTKLVLKDFTVARGLILLEPRNVEMLGGKVEAWDKQWREERKQRLKAKAGMREEG
ncbi:hypothetical protein B0A55_06556 [Friedmanniomyces simplex]|uniref:RecQ-mediated genome instability protein 1 n=1 Tax=Friedmanniomyces simplex TaxID=329884 RepID=A0A4V5NF40_9PEZI|nr:hypothetical protein B0A55_06556 [Friedmanniomyces simplex]